MAQSKKSMEDGFGFSELLQMYRDFELYRLLKQMCIDYMV